MHRFARGKGLLFALVTGMALTVGAVTPAAAAGKDDRMAAALQKFDEGKAAFEAGRFEEALRAFQSSSELVPSPNSLLYSARALRALGRTSSAYTTYRVAARSAQDRMVATGEKRYAATRDAANAEAGEIEAKVSRVTIAVPSDVPEGFTVKRDGEDVPKAAWGVAVETDPGEITIETTGPRILPFEARFRLAEGEQRRVDVKVEKMPSASLAITLATRPAGMAMDLDGQPIEPASMPAREVDVGRHKIVAHAPGYRPFSWEQDLSQGTRTDVSIVMKPEPRVSASQGTPKWLFFGVAGAAAATLGVASGMAVHATSQEDAQLALSPYSRDSNVRDSIRSQATIANVLFVTGGVLGAGAIVLAFNTRWKSEPSAQQGMTVSPWLGANVGGVGARGHF